MVRYARGTLLTDLRLSKTRMPMPTRWLNDTGTVQPQAPRSPLRPKRRLPQMRRDLQAAFEVGVLPLAGEVGVGPDVPNGFPCVAERQLALVRAETAGRARKYLT